MKKCRFKVEVSYDEQFFAEGEIQETLRTSIEILGKNKVNRYGRDAFMKNGWILGIHPKIDKVNTEVKEEEVPKLTEHKMRRLLARVKRVFSKK